MCNGKKLKVAPFKIPFVHDVVMPSGIKYTIACTIGKTTGTPFLVVSITRGDLDGGNGCITVTYGMRSITYFDNFMGAAKVHEKDTESFLTLIRAALRRLHGVEGKQ